MYANAWGGGRVSGSTRVKNYGAIDNSSKWKVKPVSGSPGKYNIQIHDSPLYINTHGGHRENAHQQLYGSTSDASSQWEFERSLKRPGHYYIKAVGKPYYMHTRYGSGSGNQLDLHKCPKDKNHPYCQWKILPQPTQ